MTPTKPAPLSFSTTEILEEEGLSCLYKGPSGTGKTFNACSWPEPVVVAYFDTNKLTLRQLLREGRQVDVVTPQTWEQYANDFIPKVTNRLFDAKTIVIDSFDLMATRLLWPDIQGTKARLAIQDFGVGLTRMIDTTNALMGAAAYLPDKPNYNIVATVHLQSETDESGGLQRITPRIMGQFKDVIEGCFDWVLLCEAEVKAKNVLRDGRTVSEKSKHFFCHTVPPTAYHTCKGGGLPAQVEGTYAALMEASGFDKPLTPTPKTTTKNKD